jgi:hypothetical protein
MMQFGVQFRGAVPANATRSWFTHSWPEACRVVWLVVPTGPTQDSAPQIESKVQVERQAANLSYWSLLGAPSYRTTYIHPSLSRPPTLLSPLTEESKVGANRFLSPLWPTLRGRDAAQER